MERLNLIINAITGIPSGESLGSGHIVAGAISAVGAIATGESLGVGHQIDFTIFVVKPQEQRTIAELKQRYGTQIIPAEELVKIKGNRIDARLVPRGVGKLDILVTSLFEEVTQGAPVTLKFSVINSGTLEPRLNW